MRLNAKFSQPELVGEDVGAEGVEGDDVEEGWEGWDGGGEVLDIMGGEFSVYSGLDPESEVKRIKIGE